MNVLGIIAEYNPFHLGHAYHLETAKKTTGADAVVAIISGSFMQRGEPAIFNKWCRSQMALANGVDLVLELPFAFASRSANYFALGAVKTLAATNIITHLAFGVEDDNDQEIISVSRFLNSEPPAFKEQLKYYLNQGYSFPKAQSLALEHLNLSINLNLPNNILAINYLQVLHQISSPIKPVPITRLGNYHSLKIEKGFASATALRNMIHQHDDQWINLVPLPTVTIINHELQFGQGAIFLSDFDQSILSILRRSTTQDLQRIIETNEGLENRVSSYAKQCSSINDLCSQLKTKRYTYTRLQRLLTHSLVNFTEDYSTKNPQYIRILGFNSKGQQLLKTMKKTATLPLITKVASGYKHLPPQGKKLLDLEFRATDLYSLASKRPDFQLGGQDLLRGPIRHEDDPSPIY